VSYPARLAALFFALAFFAMSARADELQDASKLFKQGQQAQALELVDQYLAKKPGDAQGRFLKGLILTDQNKVAEAIDVFSKLSKDYPDLPEPYNNLAVLYATQGQYEKARQQLELSIRTHPSYATAYENLGDVYTKLASQAYDKALQLDSSNSAAKNKLSLVREMISTGNRQPRASAKAPDAATEPARPTVVAAAPKSAPEAKPAAEANPAAAKPTETAAAPTGDTEEVLKAVRDWAGAWSRQDVAGYLAFYAKDFKTPNGEPREQWEATRKQRISSPKKIEVAINSPKVALGEANSAVVKFRQTYRSDQLKTNSSKTLVMTRSDGRWVIREERVGG
jgi:tetratricopeptide (TPR) repeat protein